MGFIKRNLKGSPQELKHLAYISLVQSTMEYASALSDPQLVKDKDSLERIREGQHVGLLAYMTRKPV